MRLFVGVLCCTLVLSACLSQLEDSNGYRPFSRTVFQTTYQPVALTVEAFDLSYERTDNNHQCLKNVDGDLVPYITDGVDVRTPRFGVTYFCDSNDRLLSIVDPTLQDGRLCGLLQTPEIGAISRRVEAVCYEQDDISSLLFATRTKALRRDVDLTSVPSCPSGEKVDLVTYKDASIRSEADIGFVYNVHPVGPSSSLIAKPLPPGVKPIDMDFQCPLPQ